MVLLQRARREVVAPLKRLQGLEWRCVHQPSAGHHVVERDRVVVQGLGTILGPRRQRISRGLSNRDGQIAAEVLLHIGAAVRHGRRQGEGRLDSALGIGLDGEIEQDFDSRCVGLKNDAAHELEVAKLNDGSAAACQCDASGVECHDQVGGCRKESLALEAVVLDPGDLVEFQDVAPPELMPVVVASADPEQFVRLVSLEVILLGDPRLPVEDLGAIPWVQRRIRKPSVDELGLKRIQDKLANWRRSCSKLCPHPAKKVRKCFAVVLCAVEEAGVCDDISLLGPHRLGDRAFERRMWADLDGAIKGTQGFEGCCDSFAKQDRLGHVVLPVFASELRLRGLAGAVDSRHPRGSIALGRFDLAGTQGLEILDRGVLHVWRVVGSVDKEGPSKLALLGEVFASLLNGVKVAREGDAGGCIACGDPDSTQILVLCAKGRGFFLGQSCSEHSALLAVLAARHVDSQPAVMGDEDCVAHGDLASCVRCRDLAGRVTKHGVKSHVQIAEKLDQSKLDGGAKRL